MDESRLVKAVYNHSKHLFITRKKNNLAKIIYQLTNKYNLQELWQKEETIWDARVEYKTTKAVKTYWTNKIWQTIQSKEEEEWLQELNSKPKLRTYKTIKCKLQLEPYLLSQNHKKGRYLLTGLRSGSNKLRIETGRHKRPREKEQDRICMTCMSGAIENEKHFMIHCKAYKHLRDAMLHNITTDSKGKWNLANADTNTQWKTLMEITPYNRKPIFENVKAFTYEAIKRRENI